LTDLNKLKMKRRVEANKESNNLSKQ
jgi:hypothetical protein